MDPHAVTPSATDRLTCAQCGYLLRGLDGIARCPECGLEIDQTLAMMDLHRSDPRWVTQLSVGAMLLVIAVALAIVRDATFEAEFFAIRAGSLGSFASHGALLAEWLGWWLLSTPRPGRRIEDARGSLRWWVRVAVAVHVAAHALIMVGGLGLFPWPMLRLAELLWAGVAIALVNTHLRRLANRIPDVFLIRHLPILLFVTLLTLLLLYVLPQVGSILGVSIFSRAMNARPMIEVLLWGQALYSGYVLLHLWRALSSAANAAVLHLTQGKAHDTAYV